MEVLELRYGNYDALFGALKMPVFESQASPIYQRSWQDLHRRTIAFRLVVVSYVPAMALAILATDVFANYVPARLAVYAAAAWLTMFVAADLYRQAFRCPRCGHHFFRRAAWHGWDTRHCLSCDLPLWDVPGVGKAKSEERLAR